MRTYPVKTPGIIQSIFGKYRWRFQTDKKATNAQNKEIYLTFDDGPIPEITPWVLQNLSKYKAKATFFCIGENVKRHPKIFQKIISEKHSIGNHTYNHLDGWKTNKKEYLNNVEKAEGIFRSQFREEKKDKGGEEKDKRGEEKDKREEKKDERENDKNQQADNSHKLTVNIFRPPYGKIKINQSNKILKKGYDIIMWDVLSGDFDLSLSKEKCLKNVLKNTRSGSIVVFHDSTKAFKNLEYVLPKVLEYFTEKGYVFKSI